MNTIVTLQHLPLVGHNVIAILKTGRLRVPQARIIQDGASLHINVIARSRWSKYPLIVRTIELPLKEVLRIAYEDEYGEKYVLPL